METLNRLFHHEFPGWECEHASVTETSLMLYFKPELVHTDRIPDQKGVKPKDLPLVFPEVAGTIPSSGILYTANGASREIGEAICLEVLEQGSQFINSNL